MSVLGATQEQLNTLSEPIPDSLIKRDTRHGKTIKYVTARTVMNWLDHAVGRANWKTEYRVILTRDQSTKPPTPLTVECVLSIYIDGQWVSKADVGTEDNYAPEKAAYSNALKRAGAQWGIARELYGEGNVYEEDSNDTNTEARRQSRRISDAPKRTSKPARDARKSAPAPKPDAPKAAPWYASDRLSKMVDWAAETLWMGELERPHAINRLAVALGVKGTPNGDFNALAEMVAAQLADVSDDDAMRRVQTYEPQSDGTRKKAS